MESASTGVMLWWITLGAISVANLTAWVVVATGLARRKAAMSPREYAARRRQLFLATLFVLGCAFRSALPRAEAQRICLYDGWISSAMIGRWVATVAELALVTQWSLVLRECARGAPSAFAAVASRALVPLIVVAELCSWYTTLTTNFIGSVIEESTWAVTSGLLTLGFALTWPAYRGARRRFIGAAIAINAVYMVFMSTVDVPMYRSRWKRDEESGKHTLTLGEGWRDSQRRWIVTRRWEDWREELPWMSLYFSAGVWISLSLVRAPRFVDEGAAPPAPPAPAPS